MITRYEIVDSQGNVKDTLNSQEEVDYYIQQMREQDPYEKLTVRTIKVSLIRPGLGRDPDLH
tara:strand:- start:6 stop:191 length:186 start_codon:yes stop_codon:yes gene_type:complete